MQRSLDRNRHVVFRVTLLLYVLYLAGCGWAYAYAGTIADPVMRDLAHFLAEVAAGLPWSVAVLALPSIFSEFERYASGDSFLTMVHVLTAASVGCNLLVLNHLCEWRRSARLAAEAQASR